MPDGYDRDREGYDSNQRGRIFENGTYRFFRDRDNGYVQQSKMFRTAKDRIRFDKVRDTHGRVSTIEEKSGRMEGRKDANQLKVVRTLLDRGVVQQHTLRSVEGEFRSNEVQQLIDGLARDFPDRFSHHVISRTDAREIWAIGLQREAGAQLELSGVREKARQQQREQQARAAELEKARHTEERERETTSRERSAELSRLRAWGMPPEIVRLLGLGQPESASAAVRKAHEQTPQVSRGGRGHGQERSREVARER